jgi:hypothetical protein
VSLYYDEIAEVDVGQQDQTMLLKQVYDLTTETDIIILYDPAEVRGIKGDVFQPYLTRKPPNYTWISTGFNAGSASDIETSRWLVLKDECPTAAETIELSAPPKDSDAALTLGANPEAVTISSTLASEGSAVDLLDFTMTDGGGGDETPLSVTALDVNISGTGAGSASQLTWLLNGPDATNVQGVESGGKVTFSGLSIEVADGDTTGETYTVSAYFNDNTGLTDGQTFILSIDGDTDVTVASGSTTFGTTEPVTNGAGVTIDVTATQLAFTTQPAGSTSGLALTTQPVVSAVDAAGNTDIDFSGTVSLSEAADGTLSGTTSIATVAGEASFSGLTYTATVDQQDFTLSAETDGLPSATANTVTSNVVATKLVFTTEPAPTSFRGNEEVTFTTVPELQAVDANGLLDTGFTGTVSLAEIDGAGSANITGDSATAIAGVATFSGLGLTYTNSDITSETFVLEATSGSLTAAESSELTARLAPAVSSVSSSTTDGSYKAGDEISIQVTFSEAVDVTGSPRLALETGTTDREATYANGRGTTTLTFTYTVQEGDEASDLDYKGTDALTLDGGTIESNVDEGVVAILTLASPGSSGSLGAAKAIVIDTTPPVVTDAGISTSGASGTGGAFKIGDKVIASWETSGSDGDTNITASLGSVTVDFSAFGGGSAVPATLNGTKWEATYTIEANNSTSGSNINVSVTATDEAGNTTTTDDTTGAIVDANPPVVTAESITLSGASGVGGAFKIDDTVTATWDDTSSGDNNGDIASVSVDFTEFGGGSAVAATNSSGMWTATYTITNGSIDDTDRNVTVTAIDTAGNSSNQTGSDDVVVDNIDPTVVDGDIEVSGGTGPSGAFKIGDTVTVEWTANNTDTVETVEVDFSAFGGSAAATATESGGLWTATYVLTPGSISSSSLQISVTTKATVYSANTIVPTVVVTGPTEVVTEQFTVNIEFSEAVSSDLIASEIRVENGSVASVSAVSGSSTEFTAVIDPVLGNTVLVQVLADAVTNIAGGNPNTASNEFTVLAGSVATAFDEYREEIRRVVVDEAARSLTSTLSANQRMTQHARNRFIEGLRQMSDEANGLVSRNNVPFDVDGSFALAGSTLSTSGNFFKQTGNYEGTKRRLFFGDFDIQHDADTDSTTATITARVAWEQMTSDRTMLGYFVGGELARSTIDGAFEGDQDRVGLTVGGYAVHQLQDDLFLDGFLTLGAGRNDLEMANDVLALTSDYTTRTATIGAALSGVYEYEQYEFRPELAFSYGKTWIGNVGFTGRAYGLVDDTLSLDAGNVSIANLTLRPEIVWALDADTVADSNSQLSFAPRLICERRETVQRTSDCGGGAEIGLNSRSEDGLSNVEFRVIMDKVGDTTRSSFALNLEHQF